MAKFLTDYAVSMNREPQDVIDDHAKIFRDTIAMANSSIGVRAFRPARTLNAAVYDSVMVGLAMRLAKGQKPTPEAVVKAYDKLLGDPDFQRGWVRATADEENVKIRMETAIAAFAGI